MPPRANSAAARDAAYVLHPSTELKAQSQNGSLVIDRGEGVRVWDESGKEYLEAVAGLWCASLGFSNDRLREAADRQMRKLPYYHGFGAKSHEPMIELAEMLVQRAPVPMGRAFFANSGSEANDTAVKMVWYYNNAIGRPQKKKIISRLRAYHGITVAAASLTGLPTNHKLFDLPLPGFFHVATPHHYHGAEPGETEEAFASRLVDEVEQLILREGPETVAAMWAEPVMGAGGVVIPPRTYYEKLQAVLKKYDVLFVADEVICGFGRTGSYWGSQTFDLKPDIIVCAKALSSSFLPISGVLVTQQVFDGLAEGSASVGVFGHGYTYSGHPVSAAVAIETLKIYDEMNMVEHAQRVGAHMQAELRRRFGDHPLVGEVRGIGMIGAVEIVEDKASHRNFDAGKKLGYRLAALGEKEGVLTRALGNDTIAFSPPIIATEGEVDEMLERFSRALDSFTVELRRENLTVV